MAVTSEATTIWTGNLTDGSGKTTLDSSQTGTFTVNWTARTEGCGIDNATTPEEFLAAAHASCFSMALSHSLAEEGFPPETIQTTAAVTFQAGTGVTGSHLLVSARVPNIAENDFDRIAEDAKINCPVSQALKGITITMEASLV